MRSPALTLLADILLAGWLWRTLNVDGSVPGQPGAIQVGRITLSGPTRAVIMVGLYISNVCLVICTFGLVLDAFLTLV